MKTELDQPRPHGHPLVHEVLQLSRPRTCAAVLAYHMHYAKCVSYISHKEERSALWRGPLLFVCLSEGWTGSRP